MLQACQQLEQADKSKFSRSLRIQIPRLLVATYELRNNRAIAHVGSEVDPNHMDAKIFIRSAKWMVAELVRLFSGLPPDDALAIVEAITQRTTLVVWDGEGTRRVLKPGLKSSEKVLACLSG